LNGYQKIDTGKACAKLITNNKGKAQTKTC